MNMFARFDENPAMTLRVIKETKRYGRLHGWTDARMHVWTDNVKTNKVCGGINTRNFGVKPTFSTETGLQRKFNTQRSSFSLFYIESRQQNMSKIFSYMYHLV